MAVAIVVLCLACAPMASAAGAGAGAKRTFPDVNASTPHAEDIAWLAESGISTGFPDGTFRGGDAVTRQDMAAFLRRLARLMGDESAAESKKYTCSFTDVTDATPHADDIAWLAETGISTGYPDNTFRGMTAVCRQDMAAFLRRLAARVGVGGAASWDGEPGGFPDVGATADHAADIAWLAATGVSTGYPDGTFRGMAAVARQDMAAFLHRLHKLPQDGPGKAPSYAEWAARMVNALENSDASPDVSEENLAHAWNEAKRIGIIPFGVENRNAVASRDFALCCAALACGFTDEGIESDAPDASASQHPALIDAAIKAGIGEADPDGKVRPGDAITGSEADAAEARVQELLATPATSEPTSDWKPSPGVEEIADAVADGERYIVPVPASDIKTGDKVILEPSDAMPLGAAGTVQSVEDAGAGNARIAIKQAASLDEVFDEVHVEAINVPLELGVAARAAGLDERSNERISGAYEIPFSYHPSEEVSIDGNITVSATLKIDWKKGLAPSRVTAVLSPSASLKVKALLEQHFDGVEISLLPVDLSIPLGITGASIDFNATLEPSLSGHLSLSTSAHFSAGVDYFDGHFRAVRDASIDMPELEGELTFDLGPNAGFAFFGIDIASIQPKIIPGIWGRMDFRETGMTCSDVAAYVGVGITGKLDILDPFSAFINNTFDFVQIGREETPLKWDLHWEDGHLVPECTFVCKSEDAYCTLYDDGSLVVSSSSNVDTSKVIVDRWRGLGSKEWHGKLVQFENSIKAIRFKDTVEAPVDCTRIFCEGTTDGLPALTDISLDGLDTSRTTSMEAMFAGCGSLKKLDLSPLDTRRVSNMSGLFHGCSTLTALDLSPLNTCNVTDMSYMFTFCNGLTTLDLSPLDTSHVTNMEEMFYMCDSLTSLDLSPLDTHNVTDMHDMFSRCSSLRSLDVSPLETERVTNMRHMFSYCANLKSLNLSSLDTSCLTDMSYMFYDCGSLVALDLSSLDTSQVETMQAMVCRCSHLTDMKLPSISTARVTDMSGMFSGCSSIRTLNLSSLDTSRVIDMDSMFYGCSNLIALDLSPLDTSRVNDMSLMFEGCSSLQSLNLSRLNTSNVTNLARMFRRCSSLTELDISSLDVNKVTSMYKMFDGCPAPRPPWYTESAMAA